MNCEKYFNTLRHKLDALGYQQSLPIGAIPLVNALFQDLIKTTESLRDSKLQISKLLEEKSCWELGVEPYKCDNSKLLSECNRLNIELIKQREEYEEKIVELRKKIRNLELDKRHLQEHCIELENKIRSSSTAVDTTKSTKTKKDGTTMNKKPFITTVRSGVIIPPDSQNQNLPPAKCVKCHATINFSKLSVVSAHDIEKLQNDVKEQQDLVGLYKEKIDARDREIERLSNLLTGGRPPNALAKDCCYKDVGTLSEDIELLQREKIDNVRKLNEYKISMHDAMEKAVDLIEENRILKNELDEFKKLALQIEKQANQDIENKEREINEFKNYIKKLEKDIIHLEEYKRNYKNKNNNYSDNQITSESSSADYHHSKSFKPYEDKRKLHEKLNELTVKEQELRAENERLNQKYQKIKTKLVTVQKEHDEKTQNSKVDKAISTVIDEEKIRLKSERDFFQKEYLRLTEKNGNEKKIEFLQLQINAKDNELQTLRTELEQIKSQLNTRSNDKRTPSITSVTGSPTSACVQSAILRIERERDIIKAELERVKNERDTLNEKLLTNAKMKMNEIQKYEEDIQQLKMKIMKLERTNRELTTSQIPQQTHITLMKEEIDELKKRIFELQAENKRLSTSYSQLKILHEQTEKSLIEYQNKLLIAESKLENAESRLDTLNTNRDMNRNEISLLKNEITVLKATNTQLENEKDQIISELDLKTEKLCKMEFDLQTMHKKKQEMEHKIQELQDKLDKTTKEKRERECVLHETSHETKTLRQQITALKESRDEAIRENGELSTKLADTKADLCHIKCKLKDSEKEVERLKQQLQQYVTEVQRVEELLSQKERERENMLEHYHSLSQGAIVLEGNNQSLEIEAAENRRQLKEAEQEIKKLKHEIATKDEIIVKLESQVETLSKQICSLENELYCAHDQQRLLKVDLDAVKELCEKLDLQRDKLNNELYELQNIRSKLEKENEKLRLELLSLGSNCNCSGACACAVKSTATTVEQIGDKVNVDSLQELLSASRRELEMHRSITEQMAKEMKKLRDNVEQLQKKSNEEINKATKNEALAKEYSIQIQELQNELTDERYHKAKTNSRNDSPISSDINISITNSPNSCKQEKEEIRLRAGGDDREKKSQRNKNDYNKSLIQRYPKSLNDNESFRKVTKNIHDKDKLMNDVNNFLNKGKIKKGSKTILDDRISFSEHSQDIVVRKRTTLTNKTIVRNEGNLIDKLSTPPSTYRSDNTPIINQGISNLVKKPNKSLSLDSTPRTKLQDQYKGYRKQETNTTRYGIKLEPENLKLMGSKINKRKLTEETTEKDSDDVKEKKEKRLVFQNLKSKLQEPKLKTIANNKTRRELHNVKQNIKNESLEKEKYAHLKQNRPKTFNVQSTKQVASPEKENIPKTRKTLMKKEAGDTIQHELLYVDSNTEGNEINGSIESRRNMVSEEIQTEPILKFEKSTQSSEDFEEGVNSESFFQNFKQLDLPTSTPIQLKVKNESQLLKTAEKPLQSIEISENNITRPVTPRSDLIKSDYRNFLQVNPNRSDRSPTKISSPNFINSGIRLDVMDKNNNVKQQSNLSSSPRTFLSEFKQGLIKNFEKKTVTKNAKTSPQSAHREMNLDIDDNFQKTDYTASLQERRQAFTPPAFSIDNIQEQLNLPLTPKSISSPSNYSPTKDILLDQSGKSTLRSNQSSFKFESQPDSRSSPRSVRSFQITETQNSPVSAQDQISITRGIHRMSGGTLSTDIENLEQILEPPLLTDGSDLDLDISQFQDAIESSRSSISTISPMRSEQVNEGTKRMVSYQNQSQRANNETMSGFKQIVLGKSPDYRHSGAVTFKLPIAPSPPGPPPTFRGCPCMKAKRDQLRKMVGLPISGNEDSDNEKFYYRRSIICKTEDGGNHFELFESSKRLQNHNLDPKFIRIW